MCYCTTLRASASCTLGLNKCPKLKWKAFLSIPYCIPILCLLKGHSGAAGKCISAEYDTSGQSLHIPRASYSPFHCKLNYSLSTPEVLTRQKCNQPQIEPIADNWGICPVAPHRNPLKARRTCVSQQTIQLLTYWTFQVQNWTKINLVFVIAIQIKAHYCHTAPHTYAHTHNSSSFSPLSPSSLSLSVSSRWAAADWRDITSQQRLLRRLCKRAPCVTRTPTDEGTETESATRLRSSSYLNMRQMCLAQLDLFACLRYHKQMLCNKD